MGQYIRTNGDYNIKTFEGGRITLDTGPNVGSVRVTGDLLVEGDTVYVQATDLDVEDNIITLNKGETGAGVTLDYSGISIDRGTSDSAALVWNENIAIPAGSNSSNAGGWQFVTGPEGSYGFSDSRLKVKEIVTDAGVDAGDLLLIGQGTGVVKVIGTTNYETQITHDDDIPNKKYVDDAIQNNPTFQIVSDTAGGVGSSSRVIVTDADTVGAITYLFDETGKTTFGDASAVSIITDGVLTAQFYSDKVDIFDIKIVDSTISTKPGISNRNITITPVGTGKVEISTVLQLNQIAGSAPSPVSTTTLLYGDDIASGDTGLWFVNNNSNVDLRNGELISKRKAFLYSMIF